MPSKTTFSIALVAMLTLGLAGCAPSVGGPASAGSEAGPLDLTGEWEQSNDEGDGSVHAATIVGESITIYWVAPDDTKSLYWAGTVDVPKSADVSFTWDSVNDKSKTDSALLASGDDSKTFSYSNEVISYETGALGQTWTVELKQTSVTPAAAIEQDASSDFEVKIEGATFARDYDAKPVIVVTFEFTNNSSEPESFMWALQAQAYQGGIELDDLVIGLDDVDSSLEQADIRPGATAVIQKPFILRDDSAVTIEVLESSLFSENNVLASQEFSVSS